MNALTLPETTSGEYSFRYIDIGSVNEDGKVTLDEPIRFDDAPSRARRIVKCNDVLISTVRTYLKAIAPVDFDAADVIASTGFAVCTPMKGTHPRYLAYVVRSDGVIDKICKESSGISYPAINSTKLSGIEITYCDAESQRRIVAYLDAKFAAIDRTVALLERKRAAYGKLKRAMINETVTRGLDKNAKLVDSGVDWIGKVPEGWAIKRIKDDYFLKGRIGWQGLKANEFIDEGPWLITGTDFDNGKVDWSRCYHISEERYRLDLDLQIHEGDLLVTKDGTVGKLAYIDHVPGLCSLNSHLLLMRPVKRGIDNRFMYWVLSSNVFRHYIEYESNGSTMQSLSQEAVSRFSYSAPRIEEQLRIAKYLDGECVKIDRKVELVTREIELYRKLKRSLVNEVVTGKRKVA